jgi:hypothetical protein
LGRLCLGEHGRSRGQDDGQAPESSGGGCDYFD